MKSGILLPNGTVQHRGGTALEMSNGNPLLLPREIAVEIDTGKMKVGNGTDNWNSLPYVCSCSGHSGSESNEAETHNAIYSAENLGAFTDTISANIRNGSFTNIYPCSYFDFTNVAYSYLDENDTTQSDTYSGRMRVMHLNYPQCCGDTSFKTNSILVAPDTCMFNAKMNDTNTTEGGYVGSKMRRIYLRRAEAIFKACFGEDHVLTYTEYLVNAVTDGKPSGCVLCNCKVELMDERMIFGSYQYDSGTHDETVAPEKYLTKHIQLAAFQHDNTLIANGTWYWERNVYSAADFAFVNSGGSANYYNASCVAGVRPAALIN